MKVPIIRRSGWNSIVLQQRSLLSQAQHITAFAARMSWRPGEQKRRKKDDLRGTRGLVEELTVPKLRADGMPGKRRRSALLCRKMAVRTLKMRSLVGWNSPTLSWRILSCRARMGAQPIT